MSSNKGGRRVVITGTGVVTPIGETVPTFWANIKAGKCGVTELTGIPEDDLKIKIAAQVRGFEHKERLRHFKRMQ